MAKAIGVLDVHVLLVKHVEQPCQATGDVLDTHGHHLGQRGTVAGLLKSLLGRPRVAAYDAHQAIGAGIGHGQCLHVHVGSRNRADQVGQVALFVLKKDGNLIDH